MNVRQITANIAGKKVVLEEPTVGAVEELARDFKGNMQQLIGTKHFARDLVIVSISQIDGKPIDQETFDAKETFPRQKDFGRIQTAFNTLMKVKEVSDAIIEAKHKLRKFDDDKCELSLPSGHKIVLAALTVKQDEEIELKGKYTNSEMLRCLHDKIQRAIVEIDGNKVDPATFDARVFFPRYGDWQLMSAVYAFMTQQEEDVDTFLEGVLG